MSDLIPLSLGIYGIAIVISFAVALLIKGIVVTLPLLRQAPKPDAAPDTAAGPAAAVPPEHVAAIAATVAAMAGEHHIIHIDDRGRDAVWTAEGRMIHQTSHAISRSPKR